MSDDKTYTARVIEWIENGPGCWQSTRVGVFCGDDKVGEYVRNYSFKNEFFPFQQDGKWYALYSPDYTATRVLSLPDCRDLDAVRARFFWRTRAAAVQPAPRPEAVGQDRDA